MYTNIGGAGAALNFSVRKWFKKFIGIASRRLR